MNIKSSDKLDNTILYLASNVNFNCLKKIAKLLYFIDFTNYEVKSKSLTGLRYQKYTYGPMPLDYYDLLRDMERRRIIELKGQKYAGGESQNVIPKKKPNLNVFSKDERDLLVAFVEKYKNATAGELESIAKEEPPYIMVGYKDEIPYHLAFYRNTFGEMDLENESISS